MHANARTAPIIFKVRLAFTDLIRDRKVLYDPKTSAVAVRPAVTYEEYYAITGKPGSDKLAPFSSVCDVDHLYTSNGKMICPTFSLPAGPIQFGGTCVASDALYDLDRVSFPLADGTKATVSIRAEQGEERRRGLEKVGVKGASGDWVCNKCYALSGNFTLPSVILKNVIVLRWVEERIARGTLARDLVESIRYQHDYLDRVVQGALKNGRDLVESTIPHPSYFRLHDSGDFYRPEYFEAWCEVAEAFPTIRFWASTRAWAVPSLWKQFMRCHVPKNLVIRPSGLFMGDGALKENSSLQLAAGSQIQTTRDFKAGVRVPGRVYHCPATYSKTHTCQHAEGDYAGRDDRNKKIAWPTGCRFCWDAPSRPVVYKEH